jgi:tRNA-2-methylthio-N6-dimethylallyladenosine synthase
MKVFLETYGCQMNEYDSELVRAILSKHNYEFCATADEAEVVFLNTCAVREGAQQKIYHRLNDLKNRRQSGKIRVLGILGCVAQSLRKELSETIPLLDIVAGPDSYKKLPELINTVLQQGGQGFEFSLSEYETYDDIVPARVAGVNAWIAIMRGCNNFCTFCVVPYTRGRERSRSPHSIVAEARKIVSEGFPQITLLGQNVNSYQCDGKDFADLMEMMPDVAGLRRVRFTSPHPKDFSRRLLHVMAAHPELCKHIHLPLQAGSDHILERMNRTYTKQDFLTLVAEIRQVLPQVSLTTDIICGFCGESEEDFAHTLDVVEKVGFDSAFIFKYSVRPHTIAARKYPDDVPDEVKTGRVMRLNELQRNISRQRNEAEIGKTFEVLIEGPSKKSPHEWYGLTEYNKGTVFSAPDKKPGDFVQVNVTAAGTHTLLGRLV